MGLLTLIVSVVVVAIVAAEPLINPFSSRCDLLPLFQINYDMLIHLSPFTVISSTFEFHYCTKAVYGPPDSRKPLSTGSAYAILDNVRTQTHTLQAIDNNRQWQSTFDQLRLTLNLRNVYVNMDAVNASFCIVNCASDGINYGGVICLGKTEKDEGDIQEFLNTNLNGVPGIKNMKDQCPPIYE